MKASELISHLKRAIGEVGDLEVKLPYSSGDDSRSLVGFYEIIDGSNTFFLLCDDDTADKL